MRRPAAPMIAFCTILVLVAAWGSPAAGQVQVGSTWITQPIAPDLDIADGQ